jgi:hypothetical protein
MNFDMVTIINRTSEMHDQLTKENKVQRMSTPVERAESDRINKKVKKFAEIIKLRLVNRNSVLED